MKRKKDKKEVLVMIGGGDESIFVKVKKGEKVYIGDGLWQEAGLTLEEERKRINKKLDQMEKEIIKEQKRDKREEKKEQVKQKMKSIFRK